MALATDAGLPLGLLPSEFTEHTVALAPDSRVLFFTDGISEALNDADEEFGGSRLCAFLATQECSVERLMSVVDKFRGDSSQRDDATAVLLRSVQRTTRNGDRIGETYEYLR